MQHNVQTGHCLGWGERIFIDPGLTQCFQLNQRAAELESQGESTSTDCAGVFIQNPAQPEMSLQLCDKQLHPH